MTYLPYGYPVTKVIKNGSCQSSKRDISVHEATHVVSPGLRALYRTWSQSEGGPCHSGPAETQPPMAWGDLGTLSPCREDPLPRQRI